MAINLNPSTKKALLLAIGAYITSVVVAIFIIVLVVILFIDTTHCGAVSRALPVLLGTIAVWFLISVIGVGLVTWKIISGIAGRLAIVISYGVALLVSYVIIAFGLLMVLNC